ncbi:MAG TPA: rRNA maturation RNase YbeY [Candidatus Deferrimicrobiaceae bacterium]|jgi:probable rRNA maturation factor
MSATVPMQVSIRQNVRPALFSGKALRRLILHALEVLQAEACDLRLLVVGDPEMARWNGRFMGHAGTTNVISFPEEEPVEGETSRILGDIVISAPTCLAQTSGWEGTEEERVFFFVLHGMLHLLGYDHVGDRKQARRMRARELKIYRAVVPGHVV